MNKTASLKTLSNPLCFAPNQPAGGWIAALAYSIWEQEGWPAGRDVEHWLPAEAQLRMCRLPDPT